MSTVSASKPKANTPKADLIDTTGTTVELVEGLQSFVDAFMRWTKSNVATTGPSLARLRVVNQLHCEGPQKMADLADALGVTPRNITALVDGLEAEGTVRRVPHPTDRRITMVELTERAPDATQLFAAHQTALAALCSVMSKEEQRDYLRLTRLMEERLRNAQTLES